MCSGSHYVRGCHVVTTRGVGKEESNLGGDVNWRERERYEWNIIKRKEEAHNQLLVKNMRKTWLFYKTNKAWYLELRFSNESLKSELSSPQQKGSINRKPTTESPIASQMTSTARVSSTLSWGVTWVVNSKTKLINSHQLLCRVEEARKSPPQPQPYGGPALSWLLPQPSLQIWRWTNRGTTRSKGIFGWIITIWSSQTNLK